MKQSFADAFLALGGMRGFGNLIVFLVSLSQSHDDIFLLLRPGAPDVQADFIAHLLR